MSCSITLALILVHATIIASTTNTTIALTTKKVPRVTLIYKVQIKSDGKFIQSRVNANYQLLII